MSMKMLNHAKLRVSANTGTLLLFKLFAVYERYIFGVRRPRTLQGGDSPPRSRIHSSALTHQSLASCCFLRTKNLLKLLGSPGHHLAFKASRLSNFQISQTILSQSVNSPHVASPQPASSGSPHPRQLLPRQS